MHTSLLFAPGLPFCLQNFLERTRKKRGGRALTHRQRRPSLAFTYKPDPPFAFLTTLVFDRSFFLNNPLLCVFLAATAAKIIARACSTGAHARVYTCSTSTYV